MKQLLISTAVAALIVGGGFDRVKRIGFPLLLATRFLT